MDDVRSTIICGQNMRDWTIRQQILTAVVGISAIGMVLVIIVTLSMVASISSVRCIIVIHDRVYLGAVIRFLTFPAIYHLQNTSSSSTQALERQIRSNSYNFSLAKANEISQKLSRRAASVEMVRGKIQII